MNSITQSSKSELASVLILTSSYPKYLGEPSGLFLHLLAKYLSAQGWHLTVLAPNFPGGKKIEEIEGIQIYRFNYFVPSMQGLCYRSGMLPNLRKSVILWLQVPLYLASMWYSVLKLLRTQSIDLIHVHWVLPQGIIAGLVRVFSKIPILLTVHGSDIFSFKGKLAIFLKKFSLRQASAITANSLFTSSIVNKLDRNVPINVVPMGVDTDEFNPARKNPKIRKELGIEGPMILFVGRLVENKGVQHLLQAMPSVLKIFPKAVLVIIGDGSQKDKLKKLVETMKISQSVNFLGTLSHSQLPEYYAEADVFVGLSEVEGLGVVFLEASSSGLPLVGTAIGGTADILLDGLTGIKVETDNMVELSRAIVRILRDDELNQRLSQNARDHAVKNFSWPRVAFRFAEVFNEILNTSK